MQQRGADHGRGAGDLDVVNGAPARSLIGGRLAVEVAGVAWPHRNRGTKCASTIRPTRLPLVPVRIVDPEDRITDAARAQLGN